MTTVVLLVAYFTILGALALFGAHRLVLCWWARPSAQHQIETPEEISEKQWPTVLVQLPVYNELFVAERIMEAAARLNYPLNQLQIQVLDDSTDETRMMVAKKVEALAAQNVPIKLLRRADRKGYKAGALAWGLQHSDAECVAIFDADFIPPADFLLQSIPHLMAEPDCGMVQARWTHINRNRSILTRAQGIFLDGHFAIEHRGRDQAGRCFNFNGTAGVWRRKAIEDAGGWRSLTITEDFDLSYRAQLKGWNFKYCHHIHVPAELPESWRAFRTQQARWTRGSIETCRLLFWDVCKAKHWPWRRRSEALIHLTSNVSYALMAMLGVLLPAAVVLRDQMGWRVPSGEFLLSILDLTMLTAGTFAMLIFYARALLHSNATDNPGRLRDIPLALCLGAGMSIANGLEVFRGFFSSNSEFVRTPKFGQADAAAVRKAYRVSPQRVLLFTELLFAFYYLAGLYYAIQFRLWTAIPFLLLYLVGFLLMSVGALTEGWSDARALRLTTPIRPRAEHL